MAEPAKNFEPESVRKLQTKAKLRLVESKTGEPSPVIDPSPARAKLFLVKNEFSAEVDTTNKPTAANQPARLTMVRPEQDDQVYETSGTEASNPKGEALTKKSETGKDHADSEALSDAEKSATSGSTDAASKPELTKLASTTPGEDSGSFYRKANSPTKARGRPKSLKGWAYQNQRKLFGGGIITFIVGVFMMLTFASGPLQFMHFSQLLQQFHLGNLQNTQDQRFLKQVRFWRYASNGEIEKTRLGLVGRKVAPKFETKLNLSGFKSSYSSTFGNFNGYEIDRSNPKFKGKTISEIKTIVKEQYGLDVVTPDKIGLKMSEAKNGLFIDARNLGFLDTYRLNSALLQEAGYSKLASAIGARTLCNLAGCTLHPIKKLTTSLSRAAEEKYYAKQRASEISKAREAAKLRAGSEADKNNPATTAEAAANAADAQNTLSDASTEASKINSGDTSVIEAKKNSISSTFKLGGKAAAVGGLLCVLEGINQKSAEIKKSQVEIPAVNTFMHVVSTAGQITSGEDMNASQLKYEAGFLNGTDSTGGTSSWIDSDTFQTQLGNPGKGVPSSDTLKIIGTDSRPFKEIDTGLVKGFCSWLVQGPLTLISFASGGAITIAETVIQGFLTGQFIDKAAHWLTNTAVDLFSKGADLGSVANWGGHLFSVWQFAGLGGTPLSKTAAETQAADQRIAINDTLSRKGLLYRLFSTQDANSTIAKVIDQQNPDPIKNAARMASGIFNVKGIFGSIGNIFSSKAKADSPATYDYGLPSYGFSDQELYGPIGNESPYDNASKVVTILEGSSGPDYISKAEKCFGVTIETISTTADDGTVSQAWGVNSAKNTLVNIDNGSTKDCASDTNQDDWLRIRLFILDSVTMDNMACYEGSNESCANIGISSSDSSSGNSPGDNTDPGLPVPPADPTTGYRNPFHTTDGLVASRIDEGVDYASTKAVPIYAIGDGVITRATENSTFYRPDDGAATSWITYKLTSGPAAGKYIFVAEFCTPVLVHEGDVVSSNTRLCDVQPRSIETGWALDATSQAAAAMDVYRGHRGYETAYGVNFNQLLVKLGAPSGHLDTNSDPSGQILGVLPEGWPAW